MLALKDLLIAAGVLLLAAAFAITLYDLWRMFEHRRKLVGLAAGGENAPDGVTEMEPEPIRWRGSVVLCVVACLPLLVADSIVVIPAGMGGVRVSQMRGTMPGTLYSGAHFVTPLVESVQMFDLRDKLFTAGVVEGAAPSPGAGTVEKTALEMQPLDVQSKEGLDIGMAITVRYRLDPHRLDYIESHLPQPVDSQMVPAVVASAWRGTDAGVHGAGDLQRETRGDSLAGGGCDHEEAGGGRDFGGGGDAAEHSASAGVREGAGGSAAEGATGRSADGADGYAAETGAHCRTAGRGGRGAKGEGG
jgi:hypothetical protein